MSNAPPPVPHYVTSAVIARRYHVTPQSVSMWLRRYDHTPPPDATANYGTRTIPLWLTTSIPAWDRWNATYRQES